MKKANRILCASLAAAMLLGAVPAHAATPMTAAASLIAVPLSGQLMKTGPVSDSISKALSVESTYSTEAKSASTSAPVAQTTFAAASPVRLEDGTTGATVGVAGTTTVKALEITNNGAIKGIYEQKSNFYGTTLTRISPSRQELRSKPLALIIHTREASPAQLAGATIEAGLLVDVYTKEPGSPDCIFLCQYDTRDGNPLTIPMEPFAASASRKAEVPIRESYTDVNPDDWYYDAVMALNKSGLIHTVFDLDPNGCFKPNELLTSGEVQFVYRRLGGVETKDLTMPTSFRDTTTDEYVWTNKDGSITVDKSSNGSSATRLNVLGELMYRLDTFNVTPIAQAKAEIRAADLNAIEKIARTVATDSQNGRRGNGFASYEENYTKYKNTLTRAGELDLIRMPNTPETIDFDDRITRAEFCAMLYRAGLTEFGCCALTNMKK